MTKRLPQQRILAANDYLEAVRGMWAGKFIGGTLGAPIEGVKATHRFTAPLSLPNGLCENDDTDLQLLWLHALEEHGIGLSAEVLAGEWREHVEAPWNEYGVAAANWDRGINPPRSGEISNWFFGEGMGCAIRSEIWAAIAPGAPAVATRFAAMDASLDHSGEGIEAEKLWAAAESLAFFVRDIEALLEEAVAYVRPDSRVASLVRDVMQWCAAAEPAVVRESILRKYGRPEMTHVLQNVGFTLVGLLAGGKDFERTLAITLNCGYDSDCTAATAGAILGTLLGYQGVPAHLREQVSDRYVVSEWMNGFPRAGSIEDLSRACCAFGAEVSERFDTRVKIGRLEPPARLPVKPVERVRQLPRANPFPCWRIVGPYWRSWDERIKADWERREHGNPTLPSVHYFSHNLSGFDRAWVEPAQLFSPSAGLGGASNWVRLAEDDRVPLEGLALMEGPACYYAAAQFRSDTARRAWLMLGSTGPIEAWWNGERVLHAESYQPLTPTSFPVEVSIVPGCNRVVLKVARTSQPLGACLTLKRHDGRHWHQSFIDTDIDWDVNWAVAAAPGSPPESR